MRNKEVSLKRNNALHFNISYIQSIMTCNTYRVYYCCEERKLHSQGNTQHTMRGTFNEIASQQLTLLTDTWCLKLIYQKGKIEKERKIASLTSPTALCVMKESLQPVTLLHWYTVYSVILTDGLTTGCPFKDSIH